MNESLYPHQREAVDVILSRISEGRKRIYIAMPVGTGKSSILLHAVYEYYKAQRSKPSRILIVYYNRASVQYALSFFQNVAVNRLIAGEMIEGSDTPVQITTFNKISNKERNKQALNTFDLVVFDEVNVHVNSAGAGKSLLAHVVDQLSDSILIGFGSSLVNSHTLFGKADFVYTLRRGVKEGFLLPLLISNVKLNEPFHTRWRRNNLQEGLSVETSSEFLNVLARSIVNVIQNEKTLIICRRLDFVKSLVSALDREQSRIGYSISLTSNMDPKLAADVINKFESSPFPLFIVTTPNSLKGLEFKAVRNVVLLDKINNPATLEVVLSRTMRISEGKEHLHVIDYADNDFSPFADTDNIEVKNTLEDVSDPQKSKTYINETKLKFKKKGSVKSVLGAADLAEEMAGIIRNMPDDQGAMIGIFGKWGRGKTHLMDLTWDLLRQDSFHRVDYHAWKYQDTPASWAYLYENLSQKYLDVKSKNSFHRWYASKKRLIKLNIKRKGKLPIFRAVLVFVFGVTVAWISYLLSEKAELGNGVGLLSATFSVIFALYKISKELKKEYSSQAKDLFLKYSQRHSFKEHLGMQAEIQKEILILLESWIPEKKVGQERVLLFIDDIDRCEESKIMQVIDSLRVMLEEDVISKRIVIVTAVDERILKRAIKSKYRNSLFEGDETEERPKILNTITNEYIDKLFLVGIKLGDLSFNERQEFFRAFVNDDIELEQLSKTYVDEAEAELVGIDDEPLEQAEQMSQSESLVDAVTPIEEIKPEISFKLNVQEVEILLQSLEQFTSATPRQISIFYYRYLITKNLLSRQYADLNRENIWRLPENSKLLVDLIILYGMQDNHTLINDHKVNVLQTIAPKCKVFLKEDASFDSKDYGELLKVLDIVLAY